MTSSRTTQGKRRYETFVIRLWVEDDAHFEHGEIRHVGSNAGIRFRELECALDFIGAVLRSRADSASHAE